VRMGEAWKWLRFVSKVGFGVSGNETLCSVESVLGNTCWPLEPVHVHFGTHLFSLVY
jgi:hypothetical protein